jgi:hypothetical protein
MATAARAQSPREIPADGYTLHDEHAAGVFTVQRWVNAANSEISPAGMCECITVVYEGERRVASFGVPTDISAFTVSDLTGRDISGDGQPDVVVSSWSGGAHCCYTTAVVSVGPEVRPVLDLSTGNCQGEFVDLDGDGTLEFVTCDDAWAYDYCSFADSPLPRVVYAYDAAAGRYKPDTPRFASRYRDELATSLEEAQEWMRTSNGRDPGVDKCRLLQPALGLMFSGRLDDGIVLIRGLYRGADREQFERETLEKVRDSPHWVPR